jgi:putative nucleotidyltransferase with HDIG domain
MASSTLPTVPPADSSSDALFEGIVRAMSKMVEKRDPYTAGHAEGVARLAMAIGREMGMGGEALKGLRIVGLLHDIGKVAVPAEILTKPTRLTALEREMVELHSTAGHEILQNIEFPWPVAKAVLQHHERMDGSGYPAGLRGPEIILEARILAVADLVDAMTTHRPYRAAIGIGHAMAELRRGTGLQYAEDVVAACLAAVERADRRIMVVDDEPSILEVLGEFMRRFGYEVRTFSSPQAALKSFADSPVPLVLTDLDMPGMHGIELIRRLRRISSESQIMVLTGRGGKEDAVEALRLGVSDFIDKPVSLPTLREIVEKAFHRFQEQRITPLDDLGGGASSA